MAIEISGFNGRPVSDGSEASNLVSPAPATGPASGSQGIASSRGDTLSLTSSATQMQELESQIASLPVVDTQRVEGVQQSLATGSFQVQPYETADKLLTFEASLA